MTALFSIFVYLFSVGPLSSADNSGENSLPSADKYVQVSENGHLTLGASRVRFWGSVLNYMTVRGQGEGAEDLTVLASDGPTERDRKVQLLRKAIDANAERLSALGFNLVRSWDDFDPTKSYEAGDGSPQDLFAYACSSYEKRGIKLWCPLFNNLGTLSATDSDIVEDPATASEWKEAVKEWSQSKYHSVRASKFYMFDDRTAAIRLKRMKAYADFRNLYKNGLRFADDPQVVVWELSNEEWWFASMVNGDWEAYPQFFKNALIAKWNEFLATKYGSSKSIETAWGFLLPQEHMEEKNIILAPLAKPVTDLVLNDANPDAINTQTAKTQGLDRGSFTKKRAEDVIEFLLAVVTANKLRERDAVKGWGKSCQLSPLIFDTGDGFRIQTVYLHQLADAVAMCTYLDGFAQDQQEPRFPWYSYLDEPPRMSHGVPWSEIGRIPNKPFFIYETQIKNPAKYRAEFPYRMLAQAAIQDWDIVVWHCYPRPIYPQGIEPYSKSLEVGTASFGAEGYHFRYDEVQSSAMMVAGRMFRNGSFKTVSNPTTFTFGLDLLHDPVSLDYGKSFGPYSEKLAATSFRRGLRMRVDAKAGKTEVTGETVTPRVHEACPIKSTSEIEWDWHRSSLKMQSPSAIAFTGFAGQSGGHIDFDNGLKLVDVRVNNPPGSPYPVTEGEKFISFGLAATDGRDLTTTPSMLLSLVSTSFNSNAHYLDQKVIEGRPLEGSNPGNSPVLVSRVSGVLEGPLLIGLEFRFLDWNLRELSTGVIKNGVLSIPSELPIFYVEITRPRN